MNRIKVFFLLAIMLFCGQNLRVFGQNTWNTVPYSMVQTLGTPTETVFYGLDVLSVPMKFTEVCTIPIPNCNATAYNVLDNFLYTLPQVQDFTAPFTIYRVGKLGGTLPSTVTPNYIATNAPDHIKTGVIDEYGIYFLYGPVVAGGNPGLFWIDMKVTPYVMNRLNMSATPFDCADLAYDVNNSCFYGIEGASPGNMGKIIRIIVGRSGANMTPTSATASFIGPSYTDPATGGGTGWGGMYMGSDGVLYGSFNGGGFWQIDVNNGSRVKLMDDPISLGLIALSGNDGANNPLVPIILGADIQVTKTDGNLSVLKGGTTTYTIVVRNAGPYYAPDVEIKDLVPAGIPDANMWRSPTTVTGGATALFNGGGPTGPISGIASMPVGSTITFTVKITVPPDYPYEALTNTISAIPDPNSTLDPDLSNNTAYDSDRIGILPLNPHVRGKFEK